MACQENTEVGITKQDGKLYTDRTWAWSTEEIATKYAMKITMIIPDTSGLCRRQCPMKLLSHPLYLV